MSILALCRMAAFVAVLGLFAAAVPGGGTLAVGPCNPKIERCL